MDNQPAILAPAPPSGRFLTFSLAAGADAAGVLDRLRAFTVDDATVVGIGEPLARAAGLAVDGLRTFPALTGPASSYPSTQGALWLSLDGADAGATLQRGRAFARRFDGLLSLDEEVLGFRFAEGRDLSGYVDGTENPTGDRAREVAIARDGASYVAVQRWRHDLDALAALTVDERDDVIGRHIADNQEFDEAPPSAHVKRADQKSYDPQAFLVRRSLPWGGAAEHGLYFVAFAATLDPFERILRRMAGLEDGIPDALSRFTRPLTGGYYYCPPLVDRRPSL